MADADSWATDCHKWLNVPYDSGVAFVRDADALRAAMAVTAEYLPTASPFRNPSDYTPELSRRARGVEVWAALHALGRAGVADLVTRNCAHARRFADGLRSAGYEVLNELCSIRCWWRLAMRKQQRVSSQTCSKMARAGAASRSGRGEPPCASAFRRGRPPSAMWSKAWKPFFVLLKNTRRLSRR